MNTEKTNNRHHKKKHTTKTSKRHRKTGHHKAKGGEVKGEIKVINAKPKVPCTCLVNDEPSYENERWIPNLTLDCKTIRAKDAEEMNFKKKMVKRYRQPNIDLKEHILRRCEAGPNLDSGFGTARRFATIKSLTPSPANYGSPLERYERTFKPKLQITPLSYFDWNAGNRFKEISTPWSLPCNLYKPIDTGDIAALLSRIISVQTGRPHFTPGPRAKASFESYFARISCICPPWPGCIPPCSLMPPQPSEMKQKPGGQFSRAERFTFIDHEYPAPNRYFKKIFKVVKMKPYKYPFNSSDKFPDKTVKVPLRPGPARYGPSNTRKKVVKEACGTWQFKSKTKRPEYQKEEYNAF